MKTITMYELLGLVKDGKAPKRIKQTFDDGYKEEYILDNEGWYETLDGTTKMNIFKVDRLNSIVEIPDDEDEEKKIPEKLETYKDGNNDIFLDDLCYKYMPIHKDSLSFNEQVIVDKLNEVLDYLKSKGE